MSLPPIDSFSVNEPVEAYRISTGLDQCDPTEKPGVDEWRRLVTTLYGGNATDGIVRACAQGGPSDHHAGRAWDWMRSASNPDEAAQVEEVLSWLLATDPDGNEHAMYRRLGLTYMIWNRRVWSSRTRSWEPYTGSDPHTSHVHFSFGGPGSRGDTSFFRWSRAGDYYPAAQDSGSYGMVTVLVCAIAVGAGAFAGAYAYRALAANNS